MIGGADNEQPMSVVVILTLMTNRQHRYRVPGLHLEQRDIPAAAEAYDELAQKGIFGGGLTTAKWEVFQNSNGITDRCSRALSRVEVLLGEEIE